MKTILIPAFALFILLLSIPIYSQTSEPENLKEVHSPPPVATENGFVKIVPQAHSQAQLPKNIPTPITHPIVPDQLIPGVNGEEEIILRFEQGTKVVKPGEDNPAKPGPESYDKPVVPDVVKDDAYDLPQRMIRQSTESDNLTQVEADKPYVKGTHFQTGIDKQAEGKMPANDNAERNTGEINKEQIKNTEPDKK